METINEKLTDYITERIKSLEDEVYEAFLEGNRLYGYRLEARIEELKLLKNSVLG